MLYFKMDPEPESTICLYCLMDQGLRMSKLSLVTQYLHKHFWESTHLHGIFYRHAAVHTYAMQVLTHEDILTDRHTRLKRW